ncbi:MAG: TatD family hydrolase [Patescibacteria group bacterium]
MTIFPKFFDTHSHINDSSFDGDREDVLSHMKERGVWTVVVGTDYKSSQDAATIASFAGEGVFASIGVHPIDDKGALFREPFFTDLLASPRIVAVGECGLDYSRLSEVQDISAEKERQRALFEAQVDFAIAHDLPLMIHCRDSDKGLADAHRDILAMLAAKKKLAGSKLKGNIHFFSQTIDIAREYFALDFTVSFTGVITFSREYDEVIRLAPLDRILSETDCPFVTPIPHRGKRNEPIFVEEVVKKIAEIRNEDPETVRTALVRNALRAFGLRR